MPGEPLVRQPLATLHVGLPVGGGVLDLLAPADMEGRIDRTARADDLPFWAEIWPSARALADYLAGSTIPPCPTLELGCGVGAAGLAARALGYDVLMTDRFAEAVALAQLNAGRNGLPGRAPVVADWRHWPIVARFPLVLGSDILYEPTLHEALSDVLRGTVSSGGRFLAADPCRRYALDFMAALETSGWTVSLHFPHGPPGAAPVAIYEAVRSAGSVEQEIEISVRS